jgi:diguanylate cyclase (GGDEF)-like protein
MLYLRGIQGLRAISHANGTETRLTRTPRQSRVRRPSSSRVPPRNRQDLAERLSALQVRLRRRLSRADELMETVRAVNASLEPARVAEATLARAAEWIPAAGWCVAVATDAGAVQVLSTRGLSAPMEAAASAVSQWVVRTGGVFAAADVRADPRCGQGLDLSAASLGWPLESRGRIVGALVAMDRAPAAREPGLTSATQGALQLVLEPAAVALDNAVRMQRAESLSVTDDLTQLYNSRYLSQVLRRETKRASRSGRPLSLLFVDLDGFKGINDTHGHLLGSSALVEAAAVIRMSARETDVVARFGGDEFALVLPDTGSEGAAAVGERIRERIAAHRFLLANGLDVGLTVSVGVATLPDVAASAEQLLRAADRAMYRVKEHGKDGISVAEV